MAKQKRPCWYCGRKEYLEREHMIPTSRGGSDGEANIIDACRRCNKTKNHQTLEEFRAAVALRLKLKPDAVRFFGETGKRLNFPYNANYGPRDAGDSLSVLRLAVEAGLDPRTVARAMMEGVEAMKSTYSRDRLLAASKRLKIKVPLTAKIFTS
jgi:hypothetical protein